MFLLFARHENFLEGKKMNNEIIDEVRKNRADILRSFGGDVEKMMREMMVKQGSRGHAVVTLETKGPQQGVAPNTYPLRG